MGAIVLDDLRVKSYVLPKISAAQTSINEIISTSNKLYRSLPIKDCYRSKVYNINTTITNLKMQVKNSYSIIENKADYAKKIEHSASNRGSQINSMASSLVLGATSGFNAASIGTTAIVGATTAAATTVKEVVKSVQTSFEAETGAKEVEEHKGFWGTVWDGICDFGAWVADQWNAFWDWASDKFRDFGKTVVDAGLKAWTWIKDTGAKVVDGFISACNDIWDGLCAIGSWVCDKWNSFCEWVGEVTSDLFDMVKNALAEIGEFIVRTGASIVNCAVSLVKGLVRLCEAFVDLLILAGGAIDTIFTGAVDIIDGLATGEWDWKATKALWKESVMPLVAYDATGVAFDWLYENTPLAYVDEMAFDPFKRNGTVCKVLEGVGYVAGVVAISIFTFGTGGVAIGASASVGGVTVNAGAVGLTALASGIGRHTQNAWNENSITINYGGQDVALGIDYAKASEIEKLRPGESSIISVDSQLEDGTIVPIEFKITANNNGGYSVTDNYGNTAAVSNLDVTGTLEGLGKGALGGVQDGLTGYTAVSAIGGIQQLGKAFYAAGNGNVLKGAGTVLKNVKSIGAKPILAKAAKSTLKDPGFYIDSGTYTYHNVKSMIETGEVDPLKLFGGVGLAYAQNFAGNFGGEYLNSSVSLSLADAHHVVPDVDSVQLQKDGVLWAENVDKITPNASDIDGNGLRELKPDMDNSFTNKPSVDNVHLSKDATVYEEFTDGKFNNWKNADVGAHEIERIQDNLALRARDIDAEIINAQNAGDWDKVIALRSEKSKIVKSGFGLDYGGKRVYLSRDSSVSSKYIDKNRGHIVDTTDLYISELEKYKGKGDLSPEEIKKVDDEIKRLNNSKELKFKYEDTAQKTRARAHALSTVDKSDLDKYMYSYQSENVERVLDDKLWNVVETRLIEINMKKPSTEEIMEEVRKIRSQMAGPDNDLYTRLSHTDLSDSEIEKIITEVISTDEVALVNATPALQGLGDIPPSHASVEDYYMDLANKELSGLNDTVTDEYKQFHADKFKSADGKSSTVTSLYSNDCLKYAFATPEGSGDPIDAINAGMDHIPIVIKDKSFGRQGDRQFVSPLSDSDEMIKNAKHAGDLRREALQGSGLTQEQIDQEVAAEIREVVSSATGLPTSGTDRLVRLTVITDQEVGMHLGTEGGSNSQALSGGLPIYTVDGKTFRMQEGLIDSIDWERALSTDPPSVSIIVDNIDPKTAETISKYKVMETSPGSFELVLQK